MFGHGRIGWNNSHGRDWGLNRIQACTAVQYFKIDNLNYSFLSCVAF